MNGEGRSKTNLALNLSTMISLLIAITVGGFIVANVYDITKKVEHQTMSTGNAVNQTLTQLLATQDKANLRGNATLNYFGTLFNQIIHSEDSIIVNLTDHRIIANMSRDQQIDLLKQILNQTR